MSIRKNNSDPMWDTRRARLDVTLAATFAAIVYSIYAGPETASAVCPPAFLTIGLLIGAYFGVVGYERVRLSQENKDAPVV